MKTDNEILSHYDNYYKDDLERAWRELCAKRKSDNIVNICAGRSYSSVIEIGAGEGAILENLAERGFSKQFTATEISRSGIERILEKQISKLKECVQFDGYNLNYKNAEFDLAILSHVLEHVEHPRLLLYEASRIAKEVYIEVPLEDTIFLGKDFKFDSVGHINYYTPKSIKFLTQSSGYEVIRQLVSNPSKEIFLFSQGSRGLFRFYIKEAALKLAPNISPRIFTYQSSLLLKSKKKKFELCD